MERTIQTFEVSLKAAIFRAERLLLVQEADTGFWELPGGRIDVGEEQSSHAEILAREIREELGPQFRIVTRDETVSWVRQRSTDGVYQFLIARIATYVSGVPALSDEHQALRWTGPEDWAGLEFPALSDYTAGLQRLWAIGSALG